MSADPSKVGRPGLARAGLMLGLASLATWPLLPFSIAVPVFGLAFSLQGRGSHRAFEAKVGLVASAVGVLALLAFMAVGVAHNLSGLP